MDLSEVVARLELKPHPEGGYFRETYRSAGGALVPGMGWRNHSTSIYYLLSEGDFSAFHRIRQDEIWHFYCGQPVSLHIMDETGSYELVQLGQNIGAGQKLQWVVPAGCWFAAEVAVDYALVGCTVSPGFDFSDFELALRTTMLQLYPEHRNLIIRFTR